MKTTKKALFVAMFMFSVPFITSAATTQEQYVSALQQIIVLLTQQVNMLLQQLNQLQVNPPASPVPATVISPTQVPVAPDFGSTPTPQPTPTPVVPQITKTIQFYQTSCGNYPIQGTLCYINVRYLEDNVVKPASITLSVDDTAQLSSSGDQALTGNPLTGTTITYGTDSKQTAVFTYYPTNVNLFKRTKTWNSETGEVLSTVDAVTRTFTATSNGISVTKTINIDYLPPTQ